MEVFYEFHKENLETSIALGYFDGVHIGHEKVIRQAVSYKKEGLKPIVMTFRSSPRCEIMDNEEIRLTPESKKIKIFSDLGVETLYIIDFLKIKYLTAEEFVKKVLMETLNVKRAVCGFNYTFGSGGESSAEDLKIQCFKFGINVEVVSAVKYKDEIVSSTRIRKAIADNEFLDIENMTHNL